LARELLGSRKYSGLVIASNATQGIVLPVGATISKQEGTVSLSLRLALVVAGALVALGYGLDWRGSVASEGGLALDAGMRAWARVLGCLAGLGIAILGLGLGRFRLRVGEWSVVLVVGLGVGGAGLALGNLGDAESQAGAAFEVEVIGQQFGWLLRYPGNDGELGLVDSSLVRINLNPAGLDKADGAALDAVLLRRPELRLPLGEVCVLHLRSLDVLHSFNVEDFRIRRGILPGYPQRVSFVPSKLGEFELSCAALCGLGHYRMSGKVHVMPREELDAWLAEQEAWL
jgi:heme/copper-type cytochrome/quinol oxidase subunit 2